MPDTIGLLSKMELAAKAVVDALTFTNSYTVNTGMDDERLAIPYIICCAFNTGEEVPKYTGNFIVKLRVLIANNPADSTKTVHDADAKILETAFRSDSIGATLAAAQTDFSVWDPPREVDTGSASEDHKLRSWIDLDLLCCESD